MERHGGHPVLTIYKKYNTVKPLYNGYHGKTKMLSPILRGVHKQRFNYTSKSLGPV